MAMADLWCTTKHISKKVVIDWNIEDFQKVIRLANDSLTSPQYAFTIERQFVKLHDEKAVPPGDVSISFKLSVSLEKIRGQFNLQLSVKEFWPRLQSMVKLVSHLLDKEGQVTVTKKGSISTHWSGYSDPVKFASDSMKQMLADRDLKLRCKLIMYSETTHTPVRNRPNFTDQLQLFSMSMNELRETECLTDFQLVVKGKEFNVHKVVLAARSAFFRKMLQTDMKERREGRVVIDNITPEVVEEMLTYMYTGDTSRLVEMKSELLEVADKYEINNLKILCEEALCNELTVENAMNSLLLAEMHSAEHLRAVCTESIEDNITRLKKMWKNSPLYTQLLESQITPPTKKAKLS